MAVQITGGERKRQDAPPVEPDAGKAGREVEPRGYGEMVHRADPPARPAGEYIRHHRPGSGERKRQDALPVEPDAGKAGRGVEPQGYGEMVHRADLPARPAGEYIADQDHGEERADFWRADFCKDMDVMWLRNPFPKLDRGDGEDLLISSDKFNGEARD